MVTTQTRHFLDVFDNIIASYESTPSQENISGIRTFNRVREYFDSIADGENSVVLSAAQKKKVDFITTKLQHMAHNWDRIEVNQHQLKKLFALPYDADITLLLSTYYTCFYLTAISSQSVITKRTALLNELLCAAYHDIVSTLIKEEKSHDDYFSNHIIMQLRTSKNPNVRKTYEIIEKVADKYGLLIDEIIVFIENSIRNYDTMEDRPIESLHDYLNAKIDPDNCTFDNFLQEKNLQNWFTTSEIAKYNKLFKSYITKLFDGEIGTFQAKKAKTESTNPPAPPEPQPFFPIDVFDRSNIMILWLDWWIGCPENCRDLKMEFRRLTNSIKFVDTVESCREALLNVKDRKLFCIIQGRLAKEIVPDIEQIIPSSMEPVVYLFCAQMTLYTEWALEHDCIMRGNIFDHEKDLLGRLTKDLNAYVMQKLTEELRHLSPYLLPRYIATFIGIYEQCCRTKEAFTSSHKISNDGTVAVQ